MSVKLGRNAPCHCGSGKKYKHCHLAADEAADRSASAKVLTQTPPSPPPSAESSLEDTVRQLRKFQSTGSPQQQEQVGHFLMRAEALKDYLSRKDQIQAATQKLEAHQQDFVNFLNDKPLYQDRVEAVFSEERFTDSRFSQEDLQKAFDQLGSPLGIEKEKLAAHLSSTIVLLANKDYRTFASARLMLAIPDYVAAARPLDALLVLSCANLLIAEPDSANPFLWQMFVHSYQAWTAAKQARLGV